MVLARNMSVRKECMMRKAFTLIELLIVVAIIAILAAIAVPNFLEAQVRSKVSHMKANIRTVATALEAYAVDANHYPPTTWNPTNGSWLLEQSWKIFPGIVTTPVAYITSDAAMRDIFRVAHKFSSDLANQIMYLPTFYYQPPYPGSTTAYPGQLNRYGMWVIRSAGPDTWYQNDSTHAGDYDYGNWGLASYDPTNGTVSTGDIYRSQKRSDETHN
jgi:prepilin-type N-terminal cleavage/methylation domain-containing protein